jgi:DNA topoisomerase VI subunit B
MAKAASLSRATFTRSRLGEYFTEDELSKQIGFGPAHWPVALLKELLDNALDACERAGVERPEVNVTVEQDAFTVEDNGPGLPPEVVEKALDYSTTTSCNSLYVAPTRGRQGNALKCVFAAPSVAHGPGDGPDVVISAREVEHRITASFNSIKGEPELKHEVVEAPAVKSGTSVRFRWPSAAVATRRATGRRVFTACRSWWPPSRSSTPTWRCGSTASCWLSRSARRSAGAVATPARRTGSPRRPSAT